MQVLNLLITGRGSQSLPPASGVDLVRLQDLQAALTGYAALGHTHTVNQLTDFNAGVLAVLAANGVPLSGTGSVPLLPGGGLMYAGAQLAVNSGVVSLVGHRHTATDIVNFNPAVLAVLAANGVALSGTVNLTATPGGGIIYDGLGIRVDSGIFSLANHTHAQLHNPVTLGSSATLGLTLAGQQLAGEVVLAPLSGLLLQPSGVGVDFGTGHNQVLRGDALAGLVLTGVNSVLNTTTLRLGIAGTVLSGVVPLDANPPAGYGVITAGLNGLRVRLGTDSQSAAAGNHTHTAATEAADGFLSVADKTRLDILWSETPPSGVTVYSTQTLQLQQTGQQISGVVPLNPNPPAGYGRIVSSIAGLMAAPISGVLTVTGASLTPPVNPSGVAAWFGASVNGVAYKIPLYQ